ncbi:MAG: hypothetical protein Q9187_006121 [Circinaria calcarea]
MDASELLYKDEIADADYQRTWSEAMDKGPYANPSSYKKCAVLLLCWEENSDDLDTKEEVNRLKLTFEEKFRYAVQIEYIDNRIDTKLQVQVNKKVANFVADHDAPHTLLIVYYAGHGGPGIIHGHLKLFGQISINDKVGRTESDSLVWNNTEILLLDAHADVLEIMDCCNAGTLGLTRGEQRIRKFEYIAATKAMGTTPRSGPSSFTSGLIHALGKLVEEKRRFTTLELRDEIMQAPNFTRGQEPQLSERDKHSNADRIMLHPLLEEGSCSHKLPREISRTPIAEQRTATLHFDFAGKPSLKQIKSLGEGLNKVFESHGNLGVNGVRLGSIKQYKIDRIVKTWKELTWPDQHATGKRQHSSIDDGVSNGLLNPSTIGILTPSSMSPSSPGEHHYVAEGDIAIGSTDQIVSIQQSQDHYKKRKLS